MLLQTNTPKTGSIWNEVDNSIHIIVLEDYNTKYIGFIDRWLNECTNMCFHIMLSLPRGAMSHWGLYIIRVNHSLKGTLNEDEPRVRTKPAPGYRSQISYLSADRRWTCPGDLWIWYPFFPYFPVFDTLNAIRALRAGWWKYTLFTRFNLRGWCTGPNETYPPGIITYKFQTI